MTTIALIVGIWTTTCIQTQISNVGPGHVKETYIIEENGSFEFKREWFQDSSCSFSKGTDTESGTIEISEKISTIFVSGEVYAADFSTQKGIDLGAVSVKNKAFKISRGVRNSNKRNTMLGLFEYMKQ
jgi:hypothetical protein